MKTAILFLIVIGFVGCSAKASGTATAISIASPSSGYSCFAIMNDSGQAVGGNCLKE